MPNRFADLIKVVTASAFVPNSYPIDRTQPDQPRQFDINFRPDVALNLHGIKHRRPVALISSALRGSKGWEIQTLLSVKGRARARVLWLRSGRGRAGVGDDGGALLGAATSPFAGSVAQDGAPASPQRGGAEAFERDPHAEGGLPRIEQALRQYPEYFEHPGF